MSTITDRMRRSGRRRFIESYEFSTALQTSWSTSSGPPHRAEVALAGLRGWFLACLYADNRLIGMPSKAVDEAWHEMILMTREYTYFCDRAFGRYLHHSPDSTLTNVTMDEITAETLAIVEKHSVPMTLFSADEDAGLEDGNVWRSRDLRRLRDTKRRRARKRAAPQHRELRASPAATSPAAPTPPRRRMVLLRPLRRRRRRQRRRWWLRRRRRRRVRRRRLRRRGG
jgi:hypothetical protein